VPELPDSRAAVLRLDRQRRLHGLIVTSTSSRSIGGLADALGDPTRLIGPQ